MHKDMESRSRSVLRVLSLETSHRRSNILLMQLFLLSSVATAQVEERQCSAADLDAYLRAIRAEIYEVWQPPYKHQSIGCTVLIKQNFRGEVLYVAIAKCTDDRLIHKSVIDAGYDASPIPLPANKACFENDLIVRIEYKSLT